MQYKPDPRQFPQSNVPVAVLMEGKFTSLYKNRIPPAIAESKEIGFKDQGVENRMVVIGDGDIIRNSFQKGQPMALGFDKYTGMTYGNKSFMLNVIDYLLDDQNMMSIRNKEYRLRVIDPVILEQDLSPLKFLNIGLPLLLIIIFGIVKFYIRKRSYAS
jgi:gliding-associated putative ABC transporter substrate-binding component GldG